VEHELDNLRLALSHAVEVDDCALALRVVGGLESYNLARRKPEVWDWAETAVGMAGSAAHPLVVRACCILAFAGHAQDRSAQAEQWGLRAAAHRDALAVGPDPRPDIMQVYGLAYQGRLEESGAASRRALEAAVALGDPARYDRIEAMYQLAFTGMQNGTPDVALGEEVLALARSLGNTWLLGRACLTLGLLLLDVDRPRALELLEECVALASRPAAPFWVGSALVFVAAGVAETDPIGGIRRLADAIEKYRATGTQHWVRRSLREFMSPFAALGQDEAVALFDGASSPVCNRPGQMEAARRSAQRRLGADRYAALRAQAQTASDVELVDEVLHAIACALDASTGGPHGVESGSSPSWDQQAGARDG
jgi:hypothetical protein